MSDLLPTKPIMMTTIQRQIREKLAKLEAAGLPGQERFKRGFDAGFQCAGSEIIQLRETIEEAKKEILKLNRNIYDLSHR